MKKIIVIVAVAIMGLASNVTAQKYGHMNAQELLTKVPGYTTSEAYLIKYSKDKQTAIKEMEANYQNNVAKFQREVETMTEIIKKSEYTRIQELGASVEKYKQTSYERIQKEREKLMKPLLNSLQAAITKVGKDNNFTYIFDTSSGVIVYFDGGTDVTSLVIAELAKGTKTTTGTK